MSSPTYSSWISSPHADDVSTEVQRLAGISARNHAKALRMIKQGASHQTSPASDIFSSDEN